LVNEDIVVVWSQETVYALDPASGSIIWTCDRELSEPQLISGGYLISTSSDIILARDVTNGEVEIEHELSFGGDEEETNSIDSCCRNCGEEISGGAKICPYCGRGLALLEPVVAATNKKLIVARCCQAEGFKIQCLSLESGEEIWHQDWQANIPDEKEVDSVGISSLVISGDTILVESGWSKYSGTVLTTDGGFAPLLDSDINRELRVLDLETGDGLWRCSLGDKASFVGVTGDRIYVWESGGTIRAFGKEDEMDSGDAQRRFCPDCGKIFDEKELEQEWNYCLNCGSGM
jgi:outer membrane protein assembly factor BamB